MRISGGTSAWEGHHSSRASIVEHRKEDKDGEGERTWGVESLPSLPLTVVWGSKKIDVDEKLLTLSLPD